MKLFVLLLSLQSFIVFSKSGVVINELNIIDPEKPERHEFIELKSTQDDGQSIPLRGYKLVGLSASETGTTTIELVVTLWNLKMSEKGFFTIGGNLVTEADIRIPSPYIKFRTSIFKSGQLSISNFLKNARKSLNAIGLLYAFNDPFPDIKLESGSDALKVDDNIKNILKENLVDLVVYTKLGPMNKCDIYEEIYPQFVDREYTLREFPSAVGNDITLNRCTIEIDGFLPEKIKLGQRTPNAENDCTGPKYILEKYITDVTTSIVSNHVYSSNMEIMEDTQEPSCSSGIDRTEYYSVSEDLVSQSLHKETKSTQTDACTPLQLYPNGGDVAATIDRSNLRKSRISADPNVDYSEELEWTTEKYFQ